MNVKDSKRGIFTTIGAYTSYVDNMRQKTPKPVDGYSSINNKNDIVPFLLDILKALVGSVGLKDLIGQLFTDFISNVEPQLKTMVKKQLIQYDSESQLPGNFKSTGTGVKIPAKKLDSDGYLKAKRNTAEYDLLHDGSATNFNNVLSNAIATQSTQQYNGIDMTYDPVNDDVTFRASAGISNKTIGQFFSDYVDNTTIINKKEFMTGVMNSIYGTLTKEQKRSVDGVYKDQQVDKAIENLIDNDDDSFDLQDKEKEDLLKKSKEMVDGVVNYDMGCGMMPASLSMSGMTDLISQISGSTDPFLVGNAVEATIDQSATGEVAEENKQTVKDGFFQRLIKLITMMLAKVTSTSPEIKTLLALLGSFQGRSSDIAEGLDYLKNNKAMIKCLVKEAMAMINEYIFNIVVSNMMKFLTPIIRKLIMEKINYYIGMIKSLIM
jgi:hypothetical protein